MLSDGREAVVSLGPASEDTGYDSEGYGVWTEEHPLEPVDDDGSVPP